MKNRPAARLHALLAVLATLFRYDPAGAETPGPWPGDAWRKEHRIIDLHMHINGTEEHVQRALRIMDRVGVGVGVNLSGGTVTSKEGGPSEFERVQALCERLGRPVLDTSDNGLHAMIYRLRRRIEKVTGSVVPLQSQSRVGYVFKAPIQFGSGR